MTFLSKQRKIKNRSRKGCTCETNLRHRIGYTIDYFGISETTILFSKLINYELYLAPPALTPVMVCPWRSCTWSSWTYRKQHDIQFTIKIWFESNFNRNVQNVATVFPSASLARSRLDELYERTKSGCRWTYSRRFVKRVIHQFPRKFTRCIQMKGWMSKETPRNKQTTTCDK